MSVIFCQKRNFKLFWIRHSEQNFHRCFTFISSISKFPNFDYPDYPNDSPVYELSFDGSLGNLSEIILYEKALWNSLLPTCTIFACIHRHPQKGIRWLLKNIYATNLFWSILAQFRLLSSKMKTIFFSDDVITVSHWLKDLQFRPIRGRYTVTKSSEKKSVFIFALRSLNWARIDQKRFDA